MNYDDPTDVFLNKDTKGNIYYYMFICLCPQQT